MFPHILRVIEERAFADCEYLKSVSFGEDSTLERIEREAFCGCGLESFTAPPSLKMIGYMAFSKCSALRDLRLNEGLEVMDCGCFE